MQVIPSSLQTLFVGFSRLFQDFLGQVSEEYTLFTSVANVDTPEGFAYWLTSNVRMKKWVGERQLQAMTLRFMRYKIEEYEATIAIKRKLIEDDQYGTFAPVLAQFAQGVSYWQAELVWEALANAAELICWDGTPFLYDSHPINYDDPSFGTYSNYEVNFPLTPDNYSIARTRMSLYKGEDGRYLRIRPTHLMVPPTLEDAGKKILKADSYLEIKGLPGGSYAFVPNTNLNKDSSALVVVPDLVTDVASEQKWYLLDASKPVKPFGFGLRRAIQLTAVDAPTAENVFHKGEFQYGADSRGGVFWTIPQLMFSGTGASA